MPLVRQLLKHWLFLVAASFGAYILIYNQERIYVTLPGIAEFRVVTAVAFIAAFLVGATMVTLHFLFDIIRKNLEIRRYTKRIRHLESELDNLRSASVSSSHSRGDIAPDVLV